MIKVAKFGGSSVANQEQFSKVKNIVEEDPSRRIVVVSAAGKRSPDDHKITDLLYLCHAHLQYGVSCAEIFQTIRQRFLELKAELGVSYDIEVDLDRIEARLDRDLSVDELVSRGEYLTGRLMAEYLGFVFIDAADCIFFGADGKIDSEKTCEAVSAAFHQYNRILIPGFYGALPNGRIKVMTRGGSDITGALAAAAVGASVYENWTDVSGIKMADPKIVNDPRPISKMTYAELRELSYMGASVLHEESIAPVRDKGIVLNIRNTNYPQDPGTLIVPSGGDEQGGGRFLTGVAGRRDFSIITVNKHDTSDSLTLRKALEILDRYHAHVEHITLGLDSFAFVISSKALGDAIFDVVTDLHKVCQPDDIKVQDGIALIAAVGRRMSFRPGISGQLFKALGEHGVNIRTLAQGADELAIIIGVDNKHYDTAIRVMYDEFAG